MSICEKTLKALMICQCHGNMVLLDKIKQETAIFYNMNLNMNCSLLPLFYRNITKSLRFSLFLLGMMFWNAFWSMAWLSPSLFSIAETPWKTNTGCKTGFEMPYWNFEASLSTEYFLPPSPPIWQRSCYFYFS